MPLDRAVNCVEVFATSVPLQRCGEAHDFEKSAYCGQKNAAAVGAPK